MKRKPALPALQDDALIAALAAGLKPVELSPEKRESMRQKLLARVAVASSADRPSAPPPPLTRTVRADEGEWIVVSPLVQVKILRMDVANNNQTILVRMQPGGEVVAHSHSQEEECLILEGEVEVAGHRLSSGDMHIAGPGARHEPIRTRVGALLMIRSEIPPKHFSMV